MVVRIEDLNPQEAQIVIKEKTYTLKPFSLAAQVWARSEFATRSEPDGLKILGERLKDVDLEAALKIAWKLLRERDKFKDYDDFVNKTGSYDNLMIIFKAIAQCIGVSQPEQLEEDDEIAEIKKKPEVKRVSAGRHITI